MLLIRTLQYYSILFNAFQYSSSAKAKTDSGRQMEETALCDALSGIC